MTAPRRVAIMLELDWPYDRHLGVLAGTQRYADECGQWDCVVDELADETLRAAREAGQPPPYDGVIARATAALAAEAGRSGVPVVNAWFDSPAQNLPCVAPDFAAVGLLAADHLLGLGLRRFACLSIRGNRAHALALTAYHRAVREAGCECGCITAAGDYLVRTDRRQRFHRDLARQIAGWAPPVGVFVTLPDMSSRYLAGECRKQGRRVPDDVALVAGLSEPILCLHPPPSLTSIGVSYEQVGYESARLLDRMMAGGPPAAEAAAADGPVFLPPTGVIARQSTNFMAVDDELVRAALQFMTAPGRKRVSVAEVAQSVHASRRTLERRFAAVLGRTVAGQIRLLRIDRAKRHLADPGLSIKAVARLAGFPNEQRLYEAFRRHEGTSPAQYRAARQVGR